MWFGLPVRDEMTLDAPGLRRDLPGPPPGGDSVRPRPGADPDGEGI